MIYHGRNATILCNGVNLSGDLNAVNPTSEVELADVTVFGNVGHTTFPGLAKDTCTIEALYNTTEKALFEGMVQATASSYGMMIAFGNALGKPAFSNGDVKLKSNAMKTVVTDVNRATIGVESNNWPFESGVLLSSGLQSIGVASTGQGSSVDNSAASGTTGGAAYLQVTSITGGTLTVSVQQSATGAFAGEQTTTATFAAASSTEMQRVGISSQILQYTRAAWVQTGSTAQMMLSLVRY